MPTVDELTETLTLPQQKHKAKPAPFDLVIIGAGPTGLSAAITAARERLRTLLLELAVPGGQLTTSDWITTYPAFPEGIKGGELARRLEEQVLRMGVFFRWGAATSLEPHGKVFRIFTETQPYEGKSVILAMGSGPQSLEIPGEKEFRGRGVSYSGVCDGPFYGGKRVAVVGGGDAALEDAIFLAGISNTVAVIHRRGELRAAKELQERAFQNPRIYFVWHTVVEAIEGKERITQLKLLDLKEGKSRQFPLDGVFIRVGQVPSSELVGNKIEKTPEGRIVTTDELETTLSGIFAAGAVRYGFTHQLPTALGDGCLAALSAIRYLKKLEE